MRRSLRYLTISTCDTPTGVCVHLAGVADYGVRDHLGEALAALLRHRPAVVEIDATDLRLLDCSTIAVLLDVQRRARRQGGDLCLTHAHGAVARALMLLDLLPRLTGPDRSATHATI